MTVSLSSIEVIVFNSKAFWDCFDAVRENGLGIVCRVKFALFFGHIGENDVIGVHAALPRNYHGAAVYVITCVGKCM